MKTYVSISESGCIQNYAIHVLGFWELDLTSSLGHWFSMVLQLGTTACPCFFFLLGQRELTLHR